MNYRPISVLPTLSKVFERIIHKRIISFLEKHKILDKSQFGFRKEYSTHLALTMLVDEITAALDNKEYFVGIFIDLSKAFDTVNHNIMLSKLEHYGIRGLAYDLIKNYIYQRKQYVELRNNKSKTLHIT